MSSSTQPTDASILTIGHVGSLTAFQSAVTQFQKRWQSVKSRCRSLERYKAGMMETRRYDPATQQSHRVPLETLIGEMDNLIAGHLEPILSYQTSEDASRPIDFDAVRALTDRTSALAMASRLHLPTFSEPGSIRFDTGMNISYRLRSEPPTRARPLQRGVWRELDVINADAAAMCAMLRTVRQAHEDLQAAGEKDTASGGVATSA